MDLPLCSTVGKFEQTCTATGVVTSTVIVTVKISEIFTAGKSTQWPVTQGLQEHVYIHLFQLFYKWGKSNLLNWPFQCSKSLYILLQCFKIENTKKYAFCSKFWFFKTKLLFNTSLEPFIDFYVISSSLQLMLVAYSPLLLTILCV